jgi:hypothetical protein
MGLRPRHDLVSFDWLRFTNLEEVPLSRARIAGFEIAEIAMLTAGVLAVAAIVFAI